MTIAECPSATQRALDVEDDPAVPATDFFSLTALVRQWLTTSEAVERQSRPEGDDSPLRPKWTPPPEDSAAVLRPEAAPFPRLEQVARVSDLTEAPTDVSLPALPRRRRKPVSRPTRRLAVLIDAETTEAGSAEALFDALSDQGTLSVARAYGDWSSPKTRAWWPAPLRQHGIQPYHHFGGDHDQRALVALTIDAVDLAREGAVDVVVIVGDLASLHPLVVRLNASGLQVIAFGSTPTPRDVRELCHEFVDLSGDLDTDNAGKHRARG